VPAGGAAAPLALDITERGVLDNLALRPQVRRRPGAGEVEIQVRATGLNFRDVLNAMGMYPGDPGELGGECAGVVSAVGEGVSAWTVGDEVIALAAGSFKSFVVTSAAMVFRKPASLSMAEAATIPITFLTAAYGLRDLAAMKAGDTVLVHAAAGGVGMAAVQLARQAGATVFGTAGSPEKRTFVESQGVAHVMNSRTLEFADEIPALTAGRGVDIVLNSLADDFIPKSLSVLADGGSFLEIGKRGVWDAAQVAAFNPTLHYHLYDLAEVVLREPERIRALMDELLADFESGALRPLPLQTFPIDQAAEAFRFMAQAKHIGKIVITQPEDDSPAEAPRVRADASYLITGGLGGLGLKVAEWLADRGARHLVLMGRRGPSAAAEPVLRAMEEAGVTVVVAQGDVAKAADVRRVLDEIARDLPPLRGVVHSAGVLDDGILIQQTWPRFEHVMAPKVDGAWNLHRLTHNLQLDFFVLFSTGSSLLGAPGQSNYAAANAFLDGLAHSRAAEGLAALSINWGAWAEVGMAAGLGERDHRRWTVQGMREIQPEEGVQALEQVLHLTRPQVAVLPIDWSRLGGQMKAGSVPPLLRELTRAAAGGVAAKATAATSPSLLPQLEAAAPEARLELLRRHVQEQIVKVLALDPAQPLDPLRGLSEMGMDSLTAVELANRLRATLGKPLPTTLAFEYPTLTVLVDYLATEVLALVPATNGTGAGTNGSGEPSPAAGVAEVEGMTEAEAEDSLLKELEETGY
jgi:NADPH:quinone reductase-like Zn-dependent oxidoreductase/acyl carrier protein